MRLRGAAVIHGPKLDDDILAKALDQLTAERHCQEKHPFARRHFCPLFSGLIILLFASLTSPRTTDTMDGGTDGLGRCTASFTLATTRTEAQLRPYLPWPPPLSVCPPPPHRAAQQRTRQGKSKGKRR